MGIKGKTSIRFIELLTPRLSGMQLNEAHRVQAGGGLPLWVIEFSRNARNVRLRSARSVTFSWRSWRETLSFISRNARKEIATIAT